MQPHKAPFASNLKRSKEYHTNRRSFKPVSLMRSNNNLFKVDRKSLNADSSSLEDKNEVGETRNYGCSSLQYLSQVQAQSELMKLSTASKCLNSSSSSTQYLSIKAQ